MPYVINPIPRESSAKYSVFENFLSEKECASLIDLKSSIAPEVAKVGGSLHDQKKRVSEVRWLHWGPSYEWLFSRLAGAIAGTNAKFYGFHILGFNEPLQLTHYKAARKKTGAHGHYGWHEDQSENEFFQFRKLSFVIPLNEGYTGGRFRMLHHDIPEQKLGTMIVFPSFKTHCVEPITKGERWSLVGWVTGPAFV